MAIVFNYNSKTASRRKCKASFNVSSCVDTDIRCLTDNALKYFSLCLITFTLLSVTSEIDGVCCTWLNDLGFRWAINMRVVVLTGYSPSSSSILLLFTSRVFELRVLQYSRSCLCLYLYVYLRFYLGSMFQEV
ncbi:hypothetical protein HZH66_006173 [Vespula vulgaris]|uniref:Uncharacterized protein n=1 Tax=Vespula vulgaris TaxID=7454 RepID=A0A834K5U0_VESVU|nr:hypothetical protein HZH66_006173 [Vespula vulgaris]